MSRVVPMDKALSDEDRRYLRMQGANGANIEARLDNDFPPDPDELNEFNMKERKAAAELNGEGLTLSDQAGLMNELEKLRAQLAQLEAEKAAGSPEKPNYNGWSKADLEAEIDRVNGEDEDAGLEKGTVNEMKSRLTEYFTE